MRSALGWIIRRDLLLAARTADMATVVFFAIVASLFPLGVGPEPAKLRPLAPGVLWVAALLATMLSLKRLFAADHADGTLEQMLSAAAPGGWRERSSRTGSPRACRWYCSPGSRHPVRPHRRAAAGEPAARHARYSAIGAVGAALTLGLRGGGVLLALLVLPLYARDIFGAGAVEPRRPASNPRPPLAAGGISHAVAGRRPTAPPRRRISVE